MPAVTGDFFRWFSRMVLNVIFWKASTRDERAGEGVRTLDFDLGKVALYH